MPAKPGSTSAWTDTQAIARIRIHPTNPDIVYVAALGHPYAQNAERGVFRSKDGGKTWQKVLYRDDHSGAVDLCLDPHNPDVLYRRHLGRQPHAVEPDQRRTGERAVQIHRRRRHWTEITRNPGPARRGIIGIGKIGVAVSGADSNRVYAIVENANGGVFVSDDAGATWKR